MKFGATLPRRSVPQWRAHNLDYDEIKSLIKIQTSSPEGCSREFENNLLAVLDSELERIDEFVRCKAGEIERRLSACQRNLKTLSRETGNEANNKSLKRFFKIEAEIDRISKDAQQLARYVNAQYTGFKKLLKKHAKWCRLSPSGPNSLFSKFIPHLETQRPFHRRVNFQLLLRQLSGLYVAKLDSETSADERTSIHSLAQSTPDQLQSCMTYWVHSDNEVETELFLLKHLMLQLPPTPLSSKDIQRSVQTVYLDSERWDVYEGVVPVSEGQRVLAKVPQIQWEETSRNKDVVVLIPDGEEYTSLRLKRKTASAFLTFQELDFTGPEWDESDASSMEWRTTAQKVHNYIKSSSLHPVVQLSAERTTFVNLVRDSSSNRVYAVMERNLCSTRLPSHIDFLNLGGEEELVHLDSYKSVFPHVVLTIRWEGDSPRWLQELDGSPLVERISGFSIYAHTIATLLPSQVSKLPYWMPLLQKDIRKLQPVVPTLRTKDNASPFVTTDTRTTSSQEARPSSGTIPSAPSLSGRRNSRRQGTSGYGSTSPVVYWSEFENPSEEPYTVPVDEFTSLLPWFARRKRLDLEAQQATEDSLLVRTLRKIGGAVESGVKSSADGLSTLFYEKRAIVITDDEYDEYRSESSSDVHISSPRVQAIPRDDRDRIHLLNRGYSLCVVGCAMFLSLFGTLGLVFNGDAAGIAFVLVGFLIAMTLEIVSLVRFIMQGGHPGVAWIGFIVVALTGVTFIPLVAMTEEG